MAGEIEAVGSAVTQFAVGQRVFGTCGPRLGGHAEYLCRVERGVFTQMPAGLTFEEAAAIPDGGLSALLCLRRAGLATGQKIVVYGASGSVGTAAVQLARHFDADVTAVCNTANVELVRSLGAHRVLDYTRGEDFTKHRASYDIVLDAVGKLSYLRCKRSLKPGGVYAATDGLVNFPLALWTRYVGDTRISFALPNWKPEDIRFLRDLVDAGEYRAVIDRRYPLEDVVEATRYVETGQKVGNVVLTVDARAAA
jgi:NADPH:quinone reductase-like Zn-dependent oxidoreductase